MNISYNTCKTALSNWEFIQNDLIMKYGKCFFIVWFKLARFTIWFRLKKKLFQDWHATSFYHNLSKINLEMCFLNY